MEHWLRIRGLVPLVLGTVAFLFAVGVLPRAPKDPLAVEEWRTKYGPLFKNVGPILATLGVLQLLGWL